MRIPTPMRKLLAVLLAGWAVVALYAGVERPWLLRWGATEAETRAVVAGQERLPRVAYQSTRAVTIAAPVSRVWPWLAQLGQDRVVVRSAGAGGLAPAATALHYGIFEPAHFVMERRMLANLKRLAEGGRTSRAAEFIEVALWTITVALLLAALLETVRRRRWARPLLVATAAALVFQMLTLLQPPWFVGAVFVAALAVGLAWRDPGVAAGAPRRRGAINSRYVWWPVGPWLIALTSCAGLPPPIPVVGEATHVSALTGDWSGEYVSTVTDRRGSIHFALPAGAATAYGDVMMVPAAPRRYGSTERAAAPLPAPVTLSVGFVLAAQDSVFGVLQPYEDPVSGATLVTHFAGRLHGDRIHGRYETRNNATLESSSGEWTVWRRRAPARR